MLKISRPTQLRVPVRSEGRFMSVGDAGFTRSETFVMCRSGRLLSMVPADAWSSLPSIDWFVASSWSNDKTLRLDNDGALFRAMPISFRASEEGNIVEASSTTNRVSFFAAPSADQTFPSRNAISPLSTTRRTFPRHFVPESSEAAGASHDSDISTSMYESFVSVNPKILLGLSTSLDRTQPWGSRPSTSDCSSSEMTNSGGPVTASIKSNDSQRASLSATEIVRSEADFA
mmetsp:Transcript_20745/g.84314  ORF Transcript_20745/g.84314 Transcript_20745/m.84314 type:complete len:231 (-) Transcript_20745:5256-5948(-)